ncbi:MAG TPA: FkbM family methyltransferase [Rariglobus sp.]|jgi:FkbM family methyltransferase|nr:FkbM family methyltransferase [Rariglobus sp.]
MALLNGMKISILYPEDRGYLDDITNVWLDDEYGLKSLVEAPNTIVDIGGNIGLFSLIAWHRFPSSKIFCYEPNNRVHKYTKLNLKVTSAIIFECGVSNHDGKCFMIDNSDSRLAATKNDATGNCELRSIRRVIQEAGGQIDLLKLDCEGAEWNIFQDKDALRNVKTIRMEYHLAEGRTIHDFVSTVKSIGFTIRHISPHGVYGIAWLDRN